MHLYITRLYRRVVACYALEHPMTITTCVDSGELAFIILRVD